MEPLSLIIGAALGSAGLSGALAGVVQFGRAARTARLIEHIKKALEGSDAGNGEQTLRLALDRERLRLASLSVVGAPQIFWLALGTMVITALIMIGIFASGRLSLALPFGIDRDGDGIAGEIGSPPTATFLIAAFFTAYILFFAFVMDSLIQRRRTRFISWASKPGADLPELVRSAGYVGPPRRKPRPQSSDRPLKHRGERKIIALLAIAAGTVFAGVKRLRSR